MQIKRPTWHFSLAAAFCICWSLFHRLLGRPHNRLLHLSRRLVTKALTYIWVQGPKLRLPGRQCDQKFSPGDQNFIADRQLATSKAGCYCGLHSHTYGCFLVLGAQVVQFFEHKNIHTIHFLFVFKLLFEKREGEFLATTICPLATKNLYLIASWRPY